MLAVAVAGLAAWGTLWLVQGDDDGYGGIPSLSVEARDYAAAVALGVLYLIGGQAVQFSGSEGAEMLLSGEAHYGTWALAGLALLKLLATSWSLTAGYRGGLVFPSVFAGVAVSLFAAAEFPDIAGPGVLLASVAGLLVEMTAPALGVVMLLARPSAHCHKVVTNSKLALWCRSPPRPGSRPSGSRRSIARGDGRGWRVLPCPILVSTELDRAR